MKSHPLFVLMLSLAVFLSGCAVPGAAQPSTPSGETTELAVFAAASLTEAFTELAQQFEAQHPSVHVVLNFAGSQRLAQQLGQGAPADVFASADGMQMQAVVGTGRVQGGAVEPLVQNALVVIAPADNPGKISGLRDLAQPGLRLVLAAEAVPVGRYSLRFLDATVQDAAFGPEYRRAVIDNVVSYEETVKAVLSKVVLGEADAGIVYTSDISEANESQVVQIEVPAALNQIAEYYIAPVGDSESLPLARQFVAFTRSSAGQGILAAHGFLPLR